jgi:hydrogenase maturation protein HypF
MAKLIKTYSIIVKGRVQGIGFRPFVYRQAKKFKLSGLVKNTKQGVLIECQGKCANDLIAILKNSPPNLANITAISIKQQYRPRFNNFTIEKSPKNEGSSDVVQIMPDLVICPECVTDIENEKNRRYFYPFTNCTQCGPRYSIIYQLPYDRPRTTMRNFKMCPNCKKEYADPANRRFHAQPNACPVCGPWLTLASTKMTKSSHARTDDRQTLEKVVKLLQKGKILAIRSIGGFLIACDAYNDKAIKILRLRKKRPDKPFAVMCKDLTTVEKLCHVSREEAQILKSQVSPIVLLRKKTRKGALSKLIAPKNGYLGVMLPYAPLHKLLFNVSRETFSCPDTLIMTSANPKNSPIIASSTEIRQKLSKIVGFTLDHNRPIESRCDDSIVFDYKGPIIVRYSRGYVPQPIQLKNLRLKPVVAFGADLKNHFAFGLGNQVYLSPYIGDLMSEGSISFLHEMLEKYQKWFGIKPEIVACDLHPDYVSRRIAEQYAKKHKLKLVPVQHHYAHLAGVMAEYGLKGKVVGVSYDGTGYGTDKTIWGSEVMVLDFSGFERIVHLKNMPLVGGDEAITNPRMIVKTYLSYLKHNRAESSTSISNRGTILTSSMGRLFDAVSSMLGICHNQSFEGQAPIALEDEAMNTTGLKKAQNTSIVSKNEFDPVFILEQILSLYKKGEDKSKISLWFHNMIVQMTVNACLKIRDEKQLNIVCLSGGVFQNRIILNGVHSRLENFGFNVFVNRAVPINDGGIAFGQAIIAGQK